MGAPFFENLNAYVLNRKMLLWTKAYVGNLIGVKTAVENGADIEERGGWIDGTALHYACFYGHIFVAKYLIERGAEVNCRDKDGNLPIHYACQKGLLDIVKLLAPLYGIPRFPPLYLAPYNGNAGKYLMERGSEVNIRNKYGDLPIHYACQNGHLDTVKFLINKGSDFTSTNNSGSTPLDIASRYGHTRVVDYLMQHGAGN